MNDKQRVELPVVAWIGAADLAYVRKGVDGGSITCTDVYGTDDVPVGAVALVTLASAEAYARAMAEELRGSALRVTAALRKMIQAAKYLQSRVVETRGVKCIDDMDAAIRDAEQAVALIDANKQESGNG